MSRKVLKIGMIADIVILLLCHVLNISHVRTIYGLSPEMKQNQNLIVVSNRLEIVVICLLFVLGFFLLQYNKEKKFKGFLADNIVLVPVLIVKEAMSFFLNPYYVGKLTVLLEFFSLWVSINFLMLILMLGDKIGQKKK